MQKLHLCAERLVVVRKKIKNTYAWKDKHRDLGL